jgi:hypothetical protein
MPMFTARSVRSAVFLGLLALAALPACVSAPSDASSLDDGQKLVQRSDADLVNATVSLTATTLERGQNSFLIELQPTQDGGGADGGSAAPLLTSATATMPAHGHSVTASSIEQDGAAYRVEGLDLFMSGLWQVDLAVELGASSDHVEFSLDVP